MDKSHLSRDNIAHQCRAR